ncbi:MAG TPA: Crp/Fnr family transcriptional regulator [Sphingomonas sp.]|jgi:CRP-like cAMP-binding protein|uniref:Crp/Fnr family transcriptional regulator n=1 Tax=Sphingomonas sp. TaxID=28214 RepID=UPI002ED95B68
MTQDLALLVNRLEQRRPLAPQDREAVLALPYQIRTIAHARQVVRQGERRGEFYLVLSGLIHQHRILSDGSRQITSLHVQGDILCLEDEKTALKCGVESIGESQVAVIGVAAFDRLFDASASLARAIWAETLAVASHYREWLVNLGRRNARERILHLLCELGVRLEAAGISGRDRYQVPLTQEQIGDITGLTPIHVNRVLQSLGKDGVIRRDRRMIVITDWPQAADMAGFDSSHMQTKVAEARVQPAIWRAA